MFPRDVRGANKVRQLHNDKLMGFVLIAFGLVAIYYLFGHVLNGRDG